MAKSLLLLLRSHREEGLIVFLFLNAKHMIAGHVSTRQGNGKDGPASQIAFRGDRSPMQRDDLFHQGQSDSTPFIPSRRTPFDLREAVEDSGQLLARDPDAVVLDLQLDGLVLGGEPEPHLSTL